MINKQETKQIYETLKAITNQLEALTTQLEETGLEIETFEILTEKTCSKAELLETLTTPNEFRLMNGRNINFDYWINSLNEKQIAKLESLCDSFGEENIDVETELPTKVLKFIQELLPVMDQRKSRLPKPIVELLRERVQGY